ncbi:hypothetical protein ABF215_15885 [Fusobacterium sp. THCT13E1]
MNKKLYFLVKRGFSSFLLTKIFIIVFLILTINILSIANIIDDTSVTTSPDFTPVFPIGDIPKLQTATVTFNVYLNVYSGFDAITEAMDFGILKRGEKEAIGKGVLKIKNSFNEETRLNVTYSDENPIIYLDGDSSKSELNEQLNIKLKKVEDQIIATAVSGAPEYIDIELFGSTDVSSEQEIGNYNGNVKINIKVVSNPI